MFSWIWETSSHGKYILTTSHAKSSKRKASYGDLHMGGFRMGMLPIGMFPWEGFSSLRRDLNSRSSGYHSDVLTIRLQAIIYSARANCFLSSSRDTGILMRNNYSHGKQLRLPMGNLLWETSWETLCGPWEIGSSWA